MNPDLPASARNSNPPLGGYAVFAAAFGLAFAGFLAAFRRNGGALPERLPPEDVLLLGLATHKLSRLVAKDKVTRPLRAPFTKVTESSGAGEVEEETRGRGVRGLIGEVISCPYCLDVWTAGSLACGMLALPRLTRFACAIFSSVAISDFLQQAYVRLKESSTSPASHAS